MKFTQLSLIAVLALAACSSIEPAEPYYQNWSPPSLDSLAVDREEGNAGGYLISVTGTGFGDSVDDVVVLFGNHNAEVVSVSATEIEIITPVGPLTGGSVGLLVATATGYAELEDAYTYDMGALSESTDFYEGERSYVLVQNLWNSCYGGMDDQAGGPLAGAGCESIAYYGQTGIDGRSEFFRFRYPRIHTAYQGFVSGADATPGAWNVYESFETPFPSGVDDLRRRLAERNPGGENYGDRAAIWFLNEEFAEETYCYDPSDDPADGATSCNQDGIPEYDLGEMWFCEDEDPGTGGNYTYLADWPVVHNFFEGADGPLEAVDLEMFVPEFGVDADSGGIPITLPGLTSIRAEVGFEDADAWALTGFSACGDSDGDGEAWLDEDGVVFSWEPIDEEVVLTNDHVLAASTYIHVSVSMINVGWFSGDNWGLRASIVVADDNAFDSDTGRSTVGVPNDVLYQFPSPNSSWSADTPLASFLGNIDSNASFMLMEILRVTDLVVDADGDESTTHDQIVVSYVTGDMTFPEWKNPIEGGESCGDCIDNDGDGWVDALDADCVTNQGGTGDEDGAITAAFTCSDGLDNDGDTLFDSDDPDCSNGWDGETNCGDGIDNDGDGWVDGNDEECLADPVNGQELGEDTATCSDGIDNDGDGWIDGLDSACTKGDDAETGGMDAGTECNDGIDNDGWGDPDALDPFCVEQGGAVGTTETATRITLCDNGLDDDGDGFMDVYDPDCEYTPHSRENKPFHDPAVYPLVTECYDGIDNDGDGVMDADDPSCWILIDTDSDTVGDTWVASGFSRSESADLGTDCTDGLDGDSDGWIDGLDPDCVPGADPIVESGFGTTQCNDGIDNESTPDGLIDSADSGYCTSGWGTYEGP